MTATFQNLPQQPHKKDAPHNKSAPLVDQFGRVITYLRLSLTDRCDFRCTYCMAEHMTFLPKRDLLTFEELERLSGLFIQRGVKKIRLTGGEPLVRKDAVSFIQSLSPHLKSGLLEELTMTTNGSQLSRHADSLYNAGVRRLNVSIDTLKADRFKAITRIGELEPVLDGLMAAKAAGLRIKLNTVALKGFNEDEFDHLIEFCGLHGFDLTLIEVMPMGEITANRMDQFLPLSSVKQNLEQRWTLKASTSRTGGPARYWDIAETGQKIGFISPLTGNFCDGCNRVRLTCTGKLYMCLGQDNAIDFLSAMRNGVSDAEIFAMMDQAMQQKPLGHDFAVTGSEMDGTQSRHMSVTGG